MVGFVVMFVVAFVIGMVSNFFFGTIKRLNVLEKEVKDLRAELLSLTEDVPATDDKGAVDEA